MKLSLVVILITIAYDKLMITPIDTQQQQVVTNEVARLINQAGELYGKVFSDVKVVFDLRGKAAGMYRVKTQRPWLSVCTQYERTIRFNPWLFAKYPDDSWNNTIPHEVAHYIADCRFGLSNIRPHGPEWQSIMCDFGAEPLVTAQYDLTDIPKRELKKHNYHCGCREVQLSAIRHQRVISGQQQYRCKDCQQTLVATISAIAAV